MSYTTKTKVDDLFGISVPQTVFDSLLASVKAFIDRYCGKTFEGANTENFYDGNGLEELIVDSFVGNPTVKILNQDGTTESTLAAGQGNDYVLLPLNSTEKSIIRLTGNGSYGRFPKREYAVSVLADFGGSTTVPADIELAATKMIGSIFNSAQKGGKVTSLQLGDYSISFAEMESSVGDAGVQQILDSHRDIDI